MKNRILKSIMILGVCLCLLAGCNNAEKKETLSGNATDKNTESENGEEILLDDIKDDEFKTFILETAIPGKDEGYITYRTQSQSVSGNQIDSVSKTEIKDVFGNAIFSVSINETDNETTDEDIENEILTACRAYVEYIGENGENIPSILANQSDEFIFVLAYINDDDIPEMIISTNIGMGQESVCVLSYKDGNLTSNTFYYVQYMNIATKSGIINLHSERLFADSYDLNYEIKENGEWEMLYGVREVLASETDSNQQSHLEIRYYVDNEEVTPDEYKNCSKINFTDYEYYYWDPTADGFESYYCNSENFASLIN